MSACDPGFTRGNDSDSNYVAHHTCGFKPNYVSRLKLFDQECFLLELACLHFFAHPQRRRAAAGPSQTRILLAAILRGDLSAGKR